MRPALPITLRPPSTDWWEYKYQFMTLPNASALRANQVVPFWEYVGPINRFQHSQIMPVESRTIMPVGSGEFMTSDSGEKMPVRDGEISPLNIDDLMPLSDSDGVNLPSPTELVNDVWTSDVSLVPKFD
jgi:hypothetical protein